MKSSLHNLFSLQNPSSQQPPRPLSQWERVRERAASRKACTPPTTTKMNPPEKLLTADTPTLHQRAKAMRKEMSEAEAKLWQHLRASRLNGYKFRRQQPMGNYIVDFMCVTPKLIVEADGGQHTKQAAYDHARTAYLNSLGFTVLRFWNHEILQQTNDVLAEILRVLQELENQPAR